MNSSMPVSFHCRISSKLLTSIVLICVARLSLLGLRFGRNRQAQLDPGGSEFAMQADYVIVGAGSAGCVRANRLTEDPNTRVIPLEAGGKDWNPYIHIPAGYIKLLDHTTIT
jgi:hypothetical protein